MKTTVVRASSGFEEEYFEIKTVEELDEFLKEMGFVVLSSDTVLGWRIEDLWKFQEDRRGN